MPVVPVLEPAPRPQGGRLEATRDPECSVQSGPQPFHGAIDFATISRAIGTKLLGMTT
jgi:hypothetical protein